MDKLEQLGSAHESVSELLHAIDPLLLIAIVCAAAGIPMPTILEVRYRNPRIEIPGLVKAARRPFVDLIYTTLATDGTFEIWILEIELSLDLLKVRRWALYELALESELEADAARLAVFSPEPELRGKIERRILSKIKTDPVLIQPDQIERIIDYREARRRPEQTILGCLFHAHPPSPFEARVEVFRAAWMAIQSLAERKAQRYSVAIMSIVPEAVVEQGVAELRESGELDEGRWELFTDSERKGHSFARGHREGRAEGRAEGRKSGFEEGRAQTLRRAVLDILELRGFELSAAARERVESCESIEQLERWYEAAKSASEQSIAQLLTAS
ncbi:MAG TPA: hypothetical protein VM869_27735 [Enhygromyxa sp.]|nr:hypothetical protein [Enhygromyxa sp.]